VQIPVLNGIYTNGVSDVRVSYPVNMSPVPIKNGVSNGYLRPADGISQLGTGPGIDRGGINWSGVCYRVMGTKLVSIAADGTTTTIGDVGGSGQVRMTYSFTHLAIASSGQLWLYDGAALNQVVDIDLGTCIDVAWADGYFMSTDGTNLVVTELTNPFSVNPLKYGSSEIDPDPVLGLLKLRNEIYVLNRNTIEVFTNIGGDLFPFQRIEGGQIQKGVIGTHACCVFEETIAFLGGGRNEGPSIYIGFHSQVMRIASREIDQIIETYTEAQLAQVVMEAHIDDGLSLLVINFPDRTFVYDMTSSKLVEEPVWYVLISGLQETGIYRARNLVYCYDKWLCGDPTSTKHGFITDTVSTHYGDIVRWEFGTMIVYNEGRGAIFHELELVCLTGRVALGIEPQMSTSYSTDGMSWSQERYINLGKIGERNKRIVWMQQGMMRNLRIQRFKGDSRAHLSVLRLEARLEPLAV
jgi:hypothetical protein